MRTLPERTAVQRDPTRYGTRLGEGAFTFTFDGEEFCAREGDTAASALLAHGIRHFGRSVKSRRLRGVFTGGPDEPCALLTAGEEPDVVPNVPATQLRLRPGMVLRTQNCWPSLRWDLASLLQAGSRLFTAGFYYKTFMWPSWRWFEPVIRRLAGLGTAPGIGGGQASAPVREECIDCDVLVIGAGPAGMAEAWAAVRRGQRVVVCEREPVIGGELEFEDAVIDGQPAHEWFKAVVTRCTDVGRVARSVRAGRRSPAPGPSGSLRLLLDTMAVAESGGEVFAFSTPHGSLAGACHFRIRSGEVVNAVGAVEQPLAFPGNDLPGVMLSGAAERFASRYGVMPQGPTVLFGNHDRLYATALRLRGCGADLRAIIDVRADAGTTEWTAAAISMLEAVGIRCLVGSVVAEARGSTELSAVEVRFLAGGTGERIACSTLLVSGGWMPNRGLPVGRTIGAAAGVWELSEVLGGTHPATGDPAPRLQQFHRVPCEPRDEARVYLDLQNDVTMADLRVAIAEGFVDIEHAKRYTTLGIGTDQGRVGGHLGAAVLAELLGLAPGASRPSRSRPPLMAVPLATLVGSRVGRGFKPLRQTPLHDEHVAAGGPPEPMGIWLRPRFYSPNGPDAERAAVIEARRVRAEGGICDASTLGKILVAGPAAAAFLDHLYLTKVSSLVVGRCAYRVMLREDGMVLDDGLVIREAEDRFVLTTSSSHGQHVLSHLEHYLAFGQHDRRVALVDVTDRWAVIAVAGPGSARAVGAVVGDELAARVVALRPMDFTDLPPAAGRTEVLRVLRAGFSGELAYELHVPRADAVGLWRSLQVAGLQPYGLDALDILRVEKGLLTSSEINGQVTPMDLGLEGMLAQGNPCLGRELLQRPAFHEPDRPRLVGLRAADGRTAFLAGAQLTATSGQPIPLGHVTSAVFSPQLAQTVALGFVARRIPVGACLMARDPLRGSEVPVMVVPPVHFDPEGRRARGQS